MLVLLAALILFCAGILLTIVAVSQVWRRSSKQPPASRALFVLLSVLPLIALGGFLANWFEPRDWTDTKDLAAAYQTEFGTPPPTDVSEIKSRQIVVGDSAKAWLSFKASPATIATLLERFTSSDKNTFDNAKLGATPSWWKPEDYGIVSFYSADGWKTNFAYSRALLGVDASKHVVYFCHEASN